MSPTAQVQMINEAQGKLKPDNLLRTKLSFNKRQQSPELFHFKTFQKDELDISMTKNDDLEVARQLMKRLFKDRNPVQKPKTTT